MAALRPPPFVIRHSSFVIRHSSFGVRRSAFGIRHSAFGIPMDSCRVSSMKRIATKIWREWRSLALFFMIMVPFKSAVADWNWVPTGSMKPSILEGDLVFVNKLAYDLKVPFTTLHLSTWGNPVRGDVVVFFSPQDGTRLVKRVVGVPGDTVQLKERRPLPERHSAAVFGYRFRAFPARRLRGCESRRRHRASGSVRSLRYVAAQPSGLRKFRPDRRAVRPIFHDGRLSR